MAQTESLRSVEDKVSEVMDAACGLCVHSDCDSREYCCECPVYGELQELVALVRGHEIVETARMLAQAREQMIQEIEADFKRIEIDPVKPIEIEGNNPSENEVINNG